MRVKSGVARRRSKKRVMREARGNVGGRSKLWRTVSETVIRSRAYAYRDRKVRKRDFRGLWIIRLTAACRERGVSYSSFIHGLKIAGIELNRKSLSELAISNPTVFGEIVDVAREAAATTAT